MKQKFVFWGGTATMVAVTFWRPIWVALDKVGHFFGICLGG